MKAFKEGRGLRVETKSQMGAVAIFLFSAGVLSSCSSVGTSPDKGELTRSRYLMGTTLTITVPDEEGNAEAAQAAFEEVDRVEDMITTWRDDSSLAALNASEVGRAVAVDAELFDLLERAVDWSHATESAFDPTAGRILFAWELRGAGRIPSSEEIRTARKLSGIENLVLDRSSLTVSREVDLLIEEGGFGKGYALDRARNVLEDAGVESATVDFGGQVSVFGSTPVDIAIAHPEHRLRAAMEIRVISGSVATSSGSERFFESGGDRYSHIFDPRTGRALPPRGSVTVIHESGLVADILATALYVMGPEEGLEWSDQNEITAVFIMPGASGSWVVLPSKEARRSLPIRVIDREFKVERKHES